MLGKCDLCEEAAVVFKREPIITGEYELDDKGQFWPIMKPSPEIQRYCEKHAPKEPEKSHEEILAGARPSALKGKGVFK